MLLLILYVSERRKIGDMLDTFNPLTVVCVSDLKPNGLGSKKGISIEEKNVKALFNRQI